MHRAGHPSVISCYQALIFRSLSLLLKVIEMPVGEPLKGRMAARRTSRLRPMVSMIVSRKSMSSSADTSAGMKRNIIP